MPFRPSSRSSRGSATARSNVTPDVELASLRHGLAGEIECVLNIEDALKAEMDEPNLRKLRTSPGGPDGGPARDRRGRPAPRMTSGSFTAGTLFSRRMLSELVDGSAAPAGRRAGKGAGLSAPGHGGSARQGYLSTDPRKNAVLAGRYAAL